MVILIINGKIASLKSRVSRMIREKKQTAKEKQIKQKGRENSLAFLSFEKNLIIPGKLLVGKASKTTTKFREYDTWSSSVYFYLVTCALRVNLHSAIA